MKFFIRREMHCSPNMFMCVADRGELHQVEVVNQNTTLLQEIPLFSPQEPINNILLHKVKDMNLYTHTHTSVLLLGDSLIVLCVSRARLWWAALCLWLVSRLKAALCIQTVRCVPEPEDWAVCGTQKKKPAGTQTQSEYYWNITQNRTICRKKNQRQIRAELG